MLLYLINRNAGVYDELEKFRRKKRESTNCLAGLDMRQAGYESTVDGIAALPLHCREKNSFLYLILAS